MAVDVQVAQRPQPAWGTTWTVVVQGSSVRVVVSGVGDAGPVGSPAAQADVGSRHAMRQTGLTAVCVVVVGPAQPHWGRAAALEGSGLV